MIQPFLFLHHLFLDLVDELTRLQERGRIRLKAFSIAQGVSPGLLAATQIQALKERTLMLNLALSEL